MQNRYAGDVGDFMKLGLLRYVAALPSDGGAGLTMGLNWYLAPDEGHNTDGKHISYLQPSNRHHHALRVCDPDLMHCLGRVVEHGRTVQALEECGALPTKSPTHAEMLDPVGGAVGRGLWHRRALEALAGADAAFVDPDNGIRSAAQGSKVHKFALIGELADYAARGQSLFAYHHADRSADVRTQAERRLHELADGVGQEPVGAVIARRGTCRFFLITAARDTTTYWSPACRHLDLPSHGLSDDGCDRPVPRSTERASGGNGSSTSWTAR
jgi:hypothetical protein